MAPDPAALAQALIRRPSVTPRDEGAQDVLRQALEPLGFIAHDTTSGPVRNTFFRRGHAGPHFCFCGHTDVVPPGDAASWGFPPFDGTIADGILHGRGAADMKGGIACFVAAAARFTAQYPACGGSLSLLITGDEEGEAVDGTARVLEWMAANGHIPDAALVGEPTCPDSPGDEIKIGRRGSLNGTLTVTGKQGHVAYPHLADNPLPRLVRLLGRLTAHEFDEGSAFFPPTNLELTAIDTGNTADNVIPEKATARFNVRFGPEWTAQTLGEAVRAILEEDGTPFSLALRSNAESFLTEPGPLTALAAASVREVTGRDPALTATGGTSDARFVSRYCPVIECGLVNRTIHRTDEQVPLADLEMLSAIYLRMLERFFGV